MKWSRQKFTFMVIPDANNRVVRFQLSGALLISALALILALTAAAVTAVILYGNRSDEVARLHRELTASTAQFEQIIQDKDQHIGDLQTEVVGLSDQAKSIQDKMASVNKLETQLKQLAGIKSPDSPSVAKRTDIGDDEGYAMDGEGTGGEELPVTPAEMDDLLTETHDNFSELAKSLDEMVPRLEETKDEVQRIQALLRVTPTIWPTDSHKISSPFGVRKDPFTHRARFHAGVDISGSMGDPVYAAADGVVTHTGRDGSHGNNILVSHGNGVTTHYSHLSKIVVDEGAKVRKGDKIGEMGSTGRSTGPHLHYEVFLKGELIDPEPYLQADREDN